MANFSLLARVSVDELLFFSAASRSPSPCLCGRGFEPTLGRDAHTHTRGNQLMSVSGSDWPGASQSLYLIKCSQVEPGKPSTESSYETEIRPADVL